MCAHASIIPRAVFNSQWKLLRSNYYLYSFNWIYFVLALVSPVTFMVEKGMGGAVVSHPAACALFWGSFLPAKVTLLPTVPWMGFLRRKWTLFYSCLFPWHSSQNQSHQGGRKIAAIEKTSVVGVLDSSCLHGVRTKLVRAQAFRPTLRYLS